MSLTISSAVFPVFQLIVDGTEYTLSYPITSIIVAEEKLGRSLKSLHDWLTLETKHLPAVIEAGLKQRHPDFDATEFVEKILNSLTAEAVDELHYALCKLTFPKAMAKLEETTQKASAPNVESGADKADN